MNAPTVTLSSTSGSTCGTTPLTVSGNTFGGSATKVTITENGDGSLTPTTATKSPFAFTYTPKSKDIGNKVSITVTTNIKFGSHCSAAKATYTLTVNAIPAAPVVGTIIQPTCAVATGGVVLSGLPSSGIWTLTRTPGGVIVTGTGTSTTISGLSAGTYTYTVTNSVGCTSEVSSGIVIFAWPDTPTVIITNPAAKCSPLKADLTAATVTAGSTPGLTFTYWTNATATIVYATPSTAGAGTYYIKGTTSSGCVDIKPVTVTVNPLPSANGGTGGDECDLNFRFNAIASIGTGTWMKSTGPGIATFAPDANSAAATVTVSEYGTYAFTWTEVSGACSASNVVRVVFHNLPILSAGNDTVICKAVNIQLHAHGIGSFLWTPSALINNPYISDPVANPVATTTFIVTLTDESGCKNSDDVIVEVRKNPVANAGPDQVLEYLFGTNMDAEPVDDHETGVWSLISGTGEFFDTTYAKTSVSGLSMDKNKFLWTVTNGVCPASSDTVMIIVHDLFVPTLITPNMDGKNDYFVLGGLSAMSKVELLIFDRRGVQVFKNGNYDNLWNGVDYKGNPLPDDTYYYIIKTGNGKSVSGYIVIRR